MSQEFTLKTSASDVFCPVQKNSSEIRHNANFNSEIFRNDTTAVEIIVKQVKNKKIQQSPNSDEERKVTKHITGQDIEHLSNELKEANKNLEEAKKGFRLVLFEMGKQLEAANQRELRRQTENLFLQLEMEKLNSLLEFRTNLLARMRRELHGMRRVIKFVNRGIRSVPHFHISETSEPEYTAFVNKLNDLPKQCEIGDENLTNDTTISSKI